MGVESVGLMKQVISILGATGSIGDSTLDLVRRHRDQYEVFALAGNRQWQKLVTLCVEFSPAYVVVMDEDVASSLKQGLQAASCLATTGTRHLHDSRQTHGANKRRPDQTAHWPWKNHPLGIALKTGEMKWVRPRPLLVQIR